MTSYTCPICDDVINVTLDGVLVYCKCKSLGIDHTKYYTRYLGVKPKEDPLFDQWSTQHQQTIRSLKELLINKSKTDF